MELEDLHQNQQQLKLIVSRIKKKTNSISPLNNFIVMLLFPNFVLQFYITRIIRKLNIKPLIIMIFKYLVLKKVHVI